MKITKLGRRSTSLLLLVLVSAGVPSVFGQTFELLATNIPGDELVKGADGNFYGATGEGGNPWFNTSAGTVFKLAADGVFTTVAEFDGTAGARAYGGLVQGTDGNFYGTTLDGGDLSLNNGVGYGTIFKMAPDGSLTALVTFESSNGYDVGHRGSTGTLVQGRDGNLYGTTPGNLDPDLGPIVSGTVFKVTPDGTLTTLVSFTGGNGSYPNGGLVQGSDGNLYGTTMAGGLGQGPYYQGWGIPGLGTVFRITPEGLLTTLVRFNGSDGAVPRAGLIQGNDGNFYGTTSYGGNLNGGTVFKMTANGALTTLVSFVVPPNQPQYEFPTSGPHSRLVNGRDGNFYGTTYGWSTGGGTVFQLTAAGVLSTVVLFNGTNGAAPEGGLTQGDDGNLYGVSGSAALGVAGTFFRIVLPPARPTLNLARSETRVVLSWPTNAAGFILQSSPSLGPSANWRDSADSPILVADQYFLTNSISALAQFYRLKQ